MKKINSKKLEEMSILEQVPYRPWCEDVQQEGPVDFSLKSRKDSGTGEDQVSVRNRHFVRTPDSGFSSPSENEFRKSLLYSSFSSNYNSLYAADPGLSLEEQVAPLALVKKKSETNKKELSLLSPIDTSSKRLPFPFSPEFKLSSQQTRGLQLLNSYWQQDKHLTIGPFTTSSELSPEKKSFGQSSRIFKSSFFALNSNQNISEVTL